jgi:hypothetical protein
VASIEKRVSPNGQTSYVARYRDPLGKQRNKTLTGKR